MLEKAWRASAKPNPEVGMTSQKVAADTANGKPLYAHTTPEGKETWQPLVEHLHNVAEKSAEFAAVFGAEEWGRLVGYLHDMGKVSPDFQTLLEGRKKKVDHATAGGQIAFQLFKNELFASLAAFPVMGHHAGLPNGGCVRTDTGSLYERRMRPVPDYTRYREVLPQNFSLPQSLPCQFEDVAEEEQGVVVAFFTRMLFSCLTDADWLDTERFCNPERFASRPVPVPIGDLLHEFNNYMQELPTKKDANPMITTLRREIQEHCRKAAQNKPGVFSLIVPTGGGKTFSSLAFALEHAQHHGLCRIIYVIPFTSIIEQNAAEFRKALGSLGDKAVLEHHSAYIAVDDEKSDADTVTDIRLATENWDASVIVTTAVQFFESLFSSRPAKCRRLHNIANSVIILDEAQMLPPNLLNPCVMALRELVRGYGATVVLCTATQPALTITEKLSSGFEKAEVREIIPENRLSSIFESFRRVSIDYAGILSDADLAARMLAENQVLTIVNTRARARDLFESLGDDDAHYHLSALMYPEHRKRKLDKIRERLREKKVCRVVSTSLIEAGVDIDFPTVFREATGLDSVAQAAGRCNREAKLPVPGKVTVFTPESGLPKAPFFSRRALWADWVRERFPDDLLSPEAVAAYFTQLYKHENLDESDILTQLEEALEDDEWEDFPAIPFREIDKGFRFILDDTVPLIVECDAALPLLERLQTTEDREEARTLLRRLQAYTVQIYRNYLPRLAVRIIPRYLLNVLTGATGYSEAVGLLLDDPQFREKERNIY
jgi:CRISPR-associated endonuclease/helicase Cas3